MIGTVLGTTLICTGIYGLVTGDGQGSPPTFMQGAGSIVALLIGLFFAAPGYLTLIFWKKMTAERILNFDRSGVRFYPPVRSGGFALGWNELSSVRIRVSTPLRVSNVEHPIYFRADRTNISVEFQAQDPEYLTRAHPEMKRYWAMEEQPGSYRLPMTGVSEQLPHMADAIYTYAPQSYGGVVASNRGPLK
ncbi:hypothetical protein [Bounagaea algeriensis]